MNKEKRYFDYPNYHFIFSFILIITSEKIFLPLTAKQQQQQYISLHVKTA